MKILGGHTKNDLAVLIPHAGDLKAIIMFFYECFPHWAPFPAFAISEDMTRNIYIHEDFIKLYFDI